MNSENGTLDILECETANLEKMAKVGMLTAHPYATMQKTVLIGVRTERNLNSACTIQIPH